MALSQSERDAPTSLPEAGAFSYPDLIKLSPHAERYLHQLAVDLAVGVVSLQQLSPALTQLYVFAYEQGAASRQPEIDRANDDADRLYAEVCRRPPAKDHQAIEVFLEAQKHRGAEATTKRRAEIHNQIYGSQFRPDSETENP